MTWAAMTLLLTGVLLNAGAQLLLKAGTNVLGVITLTRDNWLDTCCGAWRRKATSCSAPPATA